LSVVEQFPAIILVAPQMEENIGFVARSMKNFGFTDLRIVSPRSPLPNEKSRATSCGGADVLASAMVCETLIEALEGCDFVYACSVRSRRMNKDFYDVKEHIKDVSLTAAKGKGAILFGSERSGLENQDIALARKIIYISTNPSYGSLNLSHAVTVICHEYYANFVESGEKSKSVASKEADIKDIKYMIEDLDKKLIGTKFYIDHFRRDHMLRNITNIFDRVTLSKQEVRTLRGVFNSLYE
jgi:tRNA/rRNA methyltransferase